MTRWRLRVKQQWLLKQARDGREYTNLDIAQATGLSRATVRVYLNNEATNPTLDTLAALAFFFGCAIGDLYEEVEDRRGEALRPYPEMMPSRA